MPFSIRLEQDMVNQLTGIAVRSHRRVSDVVKEALEIYVADQARQADDLIRKCVAWTWRARPTGGCGPAKPWDPCTAFPSGSRISLRPVASPPPWALPS